MFGTVVSALVGRSSNPAPTTNPRTNSLHVNYPHAKVSPTNSLRDAPPSHNKISPQNSLNNGKVNAAGKFSDTKKGSACPFFFFISVVSSWYPLKEPKRNHCCENIKFDTYVLNIGEFVNLRLCINATKGEH